jgi:hypothetical protein
LLSYSGLLKIHFGLKVTLGDVIGDVIVDAILLSSLHLGDIGTNNFEIRIPG